VNQAELDTISRCKQGDPDALKEMYDLYHKKVYRIAYGVLRQKEDALDIVQEVFIKLFRSIQDFKGKSSFYTYLYRMALNTAIDFARKKKPPMADIEDEGLHLSGKTEERPDQVLFHKELEGRVKEAMEKLPVDQRMALFFREMEDLSYQEMAEAMGCSIGTVMSRLHYGRKKMHELLQDYMKEVGG